MPYCTFGGILITAKKMTLEELIKEVLSNGIPVTGVQYDKEKNTLVYEVGGFSKSGTAELYNEEGAIKCKTRYNRIDVINCFSDLVDVAYDWNEGYCNREPFGWDVDWLPIFEREGLVKVEKVETIKVTPNGTSSW